MNQFKDFGIKPVATSFTGKSIPIHRIFNQKITVLDFEIKDSKYKEKTPYCLHLQIELDGEKRVVFTGSTVLVEMIKQVQKSNLPFDTTIVKNGDSYEFT